MPGALIGPTPRGARGVAAAGAIVGSGAGLVLGLDAVIRGTAFQLEIPQLLAVAGGISLRLDRLGAFFLLVVDVVALPAASSARRTPGSTKVTTRSGCSEPC